MNVVHFYGDCSGGMHNHICDLCMYVEGFRHDRVSVLGSAVRDIQKKIRGADVVHCHGFRASWYVRALTRFRWSVPVVVTVHGLPGPGAGIGGRAGLIRCAERLLLPCTSRFVVVSGDLRNWLLGLNIPLDLIDVIPNGVDLEMFSPAGKRKDGPFTVGFAGRLAREKGVDRLLMAAARGQTWGRDWQLSIAGSGPCESELRELARDIGIDQRINWLGVVDRHDLPRWYRSLDVFAACSRQEGQSLAVLEAMASGVPCVVSDSGGLPEVIGDSGVIVPGGDPDTVARSVATLEDDPGLRHDLGGSARRRAAAEFSLTTWAARMSGVYRQVITASLLLLLIGGLVVAGGTFVEAGRTVVIVVDGLTLADIGLLTTLQDIDIGVGLMNVGVEGRRTRAAAWLTVASGRRAVVSDECPLVMGVDELLSWGESAGDVWRRRTGGNPRDNDLVVIDVEKIRGENDDEVGMLTQRLADEGVPMTLVGSSDLPGKQCRPVGMFTIGSGGSGTAVTRGLLRSDGKAPFGQLLDSELIAEVILSSPRPGVVVVDYGDLWRLEQERELLSPEQYVLVREQMVAEVDRLLALVFDGSERGDEVLLTTFVVPGGEGLAPVVVYDQEINSLLTSPTTRQPGLIANIDLAPTILSWQGIDPWQLSGRPIAGTRSDLGLGVLAQWEREIGMAQRLRTQAIRGYVGGFLLVVGGALVAVHFHIHHWLLLMAKLMLLAAPISFLVVPLVPFLNNLWGMIGVTLLLAGSSLALSKYRPLMPPLTLCVVLITLIIIDQAVGGYLSLRSVVGYSAVAGARYYGLGNELGGILGGASLMAAAGVAGIWKLPGRVWVIIGGVVVVAVLAVAGNPGVGANFGGAISIAAGWAAFTLYHVQRPGGWVSGAIAGVIVVMAGMAVVDAARPPEMQSHMGRLVSEALRGQWQDAIAVAGRKIDLNLRLIRYTIWSRVLLGALAGLFILSRRPVGVYHRLISECPGLGRAVRAATLGAGVGLIVNDSGVVMAATAMVIVTAFLGYWLLSERDRNMAEHQ